MMFFRISFVALSFTVFTNYTHAEVENLQSWEIDFSKIKFSCKEDLPTQKVKVGQEQKPVLGYYDQNTNTYRRESRSNFSVIYDGANYQVTGSFDGSPVRTQSCKALKGQNENYTYHPGRNDFFSPNTIRRTVKCTITNEAGTNFVLRTQVNGRVLWGKPEKTVFSIGDVQYTKEMPGRFSSIYSYKVQGNTHDTATRCTVDTKLTAAVKTEHSRDITVSGVPRSGTERR